MIGYAVTERCPDCRMPLDTLTTPPGASVIHQRRCHGRGCRKKGAPASTHYFFIKDGVARVLTGAERARMIEELQDKTAPAPHARPAPDI